MKEQIEKLYPVFTTGAAICTDTRNISQGCIFFALKGANFNGNSFAAKALSGGAAFSVIDEEPEVNDDRLIRVDDVLGFLQQFANHHRRQLNIPFFGITGSNGKTTTKELINRVLGSKYDTACTRGNLNNHIGVPLTVLSVNTSHEMAIIEMGANHQKEIELLCRIAEPTHVLVTNVGKAHLEGFGGFEGVKKGKGEMYDFARAHDAVVFINDDNVHLNEMLGKYQKTFRYGTRTSSDVIGTIQEEGTFVSLKWKTNSADDWNFVSSQITGAYNFENILSAVAAGVYFGVDAPLINGSIASYQPDNQRSQVISRGTHQVVLDAYNANPTSMEAALKNFDANFKGKRAVMLGDMFELGSSSGQEHQSIAELVSAFDFDLVLLVGPNFKATNAISSAHYFENSAEAAAWIREQDLKDYKILIKGSRGSKMETVLDAISGS
jgi:UDP-N-acetylmuramoyl-tripeptide--D-alanyl-D-alanine ligase